MADTKELIGARLGKDEIRILDEIVNHGFAPNRSEAVRVAVRAAPIGLAANVLKRVETLRRQSAALATELERIQVEQAAIDVDEAERRRIAQLERLLDASQPRRRVPHARR